MTSGQPMSANSGYLEQLQGQLQAESAESAQLCRNLQDNPICTVTLDDSIPALFVVWKQYANSTQLRFILESIINLLRQHRVSRILGDDAALTMIHAEDQAWITQQWMPRAIAAGLRVAANRIPDEYFAKLSVYSIVSVAPRGVMIRSFNDLNTARQWLRNFGT